MITLIPFLAQSGRKLAIGGVIIAGVTAYLAYRGASATWQYYLTAEECLAERRSLAGQRVRVSGEGGGTRTARPLNPAEPEGCRYRPCLCAASRALR